MSELTRRRFLQAGALALAGGGALAGLYTWQVEPEWMEMTRQPLPVRDLPSALSGKLLVQLSDIHVGPSVSEAYVADVFARVTALRPDIVVYTGDFTSHHDALYAQTERAYADAPRGALGTVGVLGNHDYGINWAEPDVATRLSAILRAAGIEMLSNEVTTVAGLQVVGMDDLWAAQFHPERALAKLDAKAPAIALSHNPDTVDLPGWGAYRGWVLSGHTHGGQCKPQFLPPPILPVRNKRHSAGVFELDGERRMYISRGVGHVMKVRFNVRPEVALFDLQAA